MRILLSLVVTLIAYGSFFPFDYVPHVPSQADLVHLFLVWPRRISTADAAGNLLLFLPLGLCMAALIRRRWAWIPAMLAGIAFAWVLQYLQFWFPSRDPSASDAWFNTAGIVLGLGLGAWLRALTHRHTARLMEAPPLWPVAVGLALLWLAYRWFPLVPSLDIVNLHQALWPLRSLSWNRAHVLHDAAGWLLWFLLLRHTPWHGLSDRVTATFAVTVLLVEPFFWHSVVSLSNVLGLLLALAVRPWFLREPAAARRVVVVLLTSILISGLTPWPRLPYALSFMWMPFAGLLNGNMIGNTAALINKCYLYGGVILLLGQIGLRFPLAGLLLGSGLWGIEWLQRFSPGRTPELTDPLLALLLGGIFQTVLSVRREVSRQVAQGRASAVSERTSEALPSVQQAAINALVRSAPSTGSDKP
jgi:VanZ family protein